MSFKDIIANDLKIFNNPDEFAEIKRVEYNGKEYHIPLILDNFTSERDRIRRDDYAEGVYLYDAMVCFAEADMGGAPRKNVRITIEDELYVITSVSREMGELVLYLNQFTE